MERDRETQTEIPDFSGDFVVEEVPSGTCAVFQAVEAHSTTTTITTECDCHDRMGEEGVSSFIVVFTSK